MDPFAANRDDDRRARILQVNERRARRWRIAERVAAVAVPVLLVLALGVACVWGTNETARADMMERGISELYRQSFYELNDNVNDMQVALKKLLVVSSSQQHILLLSDVWRLSGAAAANMANLPQSHVDTMDIKQFVTRAGDYAHTLARRVLNGEMLSDTDKEQINALYEASVRVARDLEWRLQNGDIPTQVIDGDGYYQDSTDAAKQEGSEADQGGQSEESVSDYPKLIYDGPFSESTEKAEPRGIEGGDVDANTAMQAAAQYLGGGSLQQSGETNGAIPSYTFAGTNGNGREVEVAVTKKGGKVLWMMAATEGDESGVPDENTTKQYADAAKKYLDDRGYENMQPTYAQYYSGVAVLNFAATQDDVILYADLVKVYVERKSGEVVGVDANNYLFSHTKRDLGAPAIDENTAKAGVNDALEVQSVKLALIPKTANTEVLCYEFKGKCRGADFIVYINANNGAEEEVYEIINSDEGQLVI